MINDEIYMHRALQLARNGVGAASPNPMVGAVIVCNKTIIGEGWHRRCGEAHAEVNAVESVADKSLLAQSTIYVTLEPCSHFGKTPPCCDLLIKHRFARVVVGTVDPFSKVSGNGINRLRAAGIDVEVGVLEQECAELNKKFFTAHLNKRPYVLLKWAESADGFISADGGAPVKISTEESVMLMHKERSEYDAILVGGNTVQTDNPSLSVRYWSGKSPVRVVVSKSGNIPSSASVFTDGNPTIVYTYTPVKLSNIRNVDVVILDHCSATIQQILTNLYERNITSIMVEGGKAMLEMFMATGLWDEIRVEKNLSVVLRNGVKAPAITSGILTNVEKHFKNIIYRYKKE